MPRLFNNTTNDLNSADLTEKYIPRDQWTKDVLKLMLTVCLMASLVVLIGILLGIFLVIDTLPLFIFTAVIFVSWMGVRFRHWRIPRYIPAVSCFALGVLGSYTSGFSSSGLFFGLAILLSGMLVGIQYQRITIFGAVVSITYFNVIYRGGNFLEELGSLITIVTALIGVAIIQWYYDIRVRSILADRIEVNQTLSEEIEHRRLVESVKTEQEALLMRLANHISDTITEISPDGIIRYASPSYNEVLGTPPELVIGTDAMILIHPEDIQRATSDLAKSAEQHTNITDDIRCRHADGHYITLEICCSPVIGLGGKLEGFVLCGRDRVKPIAKQPAKVSNSLAENFPLALQFFTLEEDGELVLTGANQAADTLLGIDHSRLLGNSLTAIFPELAGTDAVDHYRKVALLGEPWTFRLEEYSYDKIRGEFSITVFRTSHGNLGVLFVRDQMEPASASAASQHSIY